MPDLGLSRSAKTAWCVAAFVFVFLFLPALLPAMPQRSTPHKTVYTGPLVCYKDEIVSRHVLICDYPVAPSGLNQR